MKLREKVATLLLGKGSYSGDLEDAMRDAGDILAALPCRATCVHQNCDECPVSAEMIEKADAYQAYNDTIKHHWLDIKEWKGKAELLDRINNLYRTEKLPTFTRIEDVREWKEKAEKWDTWTRKLTDQNKDLDLIMKDLEVVEKGCSYCTKFHTGLNEMGLSFQEYACPYCHGKGSIARPATPEEVALFLSRIVPLIHKHRDYPGTLYTGLLNKSVELEDGSILRLKGEGK